jgi:hypothetical protein
MLFIISPRYIYLLFWAMSGALSGAFHRIIMLLRAL